MGELAIMDRQAGDLKVIWDSATPTFFADAGQTAKDYEDPDEKQETKLWGAE